MRKKESQQKGVKKMRIYNTNYKIREEQYRISEKKQEEVDQRIGDRDRDVAESKECCVDWESIDNFTEWAQSQW